MPSPAEVARSEAAPRRPARTTLQPGHLHRGRRRGRPRAPPCRRAPHRAGCPTGRRAARATTPRARGSACWRRMIATATTNGSKRQVGQPARPRTRGAADDDEGHDHGRCARRRPRADATPRPRPTGLRRRRARCRAASPIGPAAWTSESSTWATAIGLCQSACGALAKGMPCGTAPVSRMTSPMATTHIRSEPRIVRPARSAIQSATESSGSGNGRRAGPCRSSLSRIAFPQAGSGRRRLDHNASREPRPGRR